MTAWLPAAWARTTGRLARDRHAPRRL